MEYLEWDSTYIHYSSFYVAAGVSWSLYYLVLATSQLAPAKGCWSKFQDTCNCVTIIPCLCNNFTMLYNNFTMLCNNFTMLCNTFPIGLQHYSLKTKPSVPKNGLGWPQNDLGGCRDQAYHFQHQNLPLYA